MRAKAARNAARTTTTRPSATSSSAAWSACARAPTTRWRSTRSCRSSWDFFCLDQIRYHGRWLTILWDKTGERYGKGTGLRVFADGKEIAACADR